MISYALTGGIGSGKTLVSKIFSLLGAAVFNADESAKSFYHRPEIIQKISTEISPECIIEGKVDLKRLAGIVFSDAKMLGKLNALLHPLVMESYQEWLSGQAADTVCILESAIIFESGLESRFDKIICVYAPAEICIKRVMQRDGVPVEKVRERMQMQFDPEIKKERADYVIMNDDRELVLPQVIALYNHFKDQLA